MRAIVLAKCIKHGQIIFYKWEEIINKPAYKILVGKLEGCLEEDGRIILKWILKCRV
jgi:hypothetical protein